MKLDFNLENIPKKYNINFIYMDWFNNIKDKYLIQDLKESKEEKCIGFHQSNEEKIFDSQKLCKFCHIKNWDSGSARRNWDSANSYYGETTKNIF